MMHRVVVSPEQFREINRELAQFRSRIESICSDLTGSFGAESRPVILAEEVLDAVQRLESQLQREQAKPLWKAAY